MSAIPHPGSAPSSGNGGEESAPIDEINRAGQRIQELVEKIEAHPDETGRALMHECLHTLLGFYGHGLERILQIVRRTGANGQIICDELLRDKVVSGLLLIHGLHPVDLETRLHQALAKIRPYMESHGGDVELLSLEGDFARLRLKGSCESCPSSSVTMELAVRQALEEACPDLLGFEVEGAVANQAVAPHAAPEWTTVPHAGQIAEGAFLPVTVAEVGLIVCRVGGQLYAYRDRCPACNLPLHLGGLEAGVLSCRAGHRYHVREAGRAVDGAAGYLDPVPLLVRNQSVQVSLARPADEALAS